MKTDTPASSHNPEDKPEERRGEKRGKKSIKKDKNKKTEAVCNTSTSVVMHFMECVQSSFQRDSQQSYCASTAVCVCLGVFSGPQ